MEMFENNYLELGFAFWAIVVYISVCLFIIIFWRSVISFLSRLKRWLKGSRITYYFPTKKTEIYRTSFPCRHYNDRKYIDDSVIEINRGLFRRRSAIYGSGIMNWKIENVRRWIDGDSRDCVSLTDTSGLPAEIALRMINSFSSLQAMLDRIADLEERLQYVLQENYDLVCKLGTAEKTNREWAAAVKVVIEKMLDQKDRRRNNQRFRSKNAEEIRENLEKIISDQEVTTFDGNLVEQYRCLFDGREYWPVDP